MPWVTSCKLTFPKIEKPFFFAKLYRFLEWLKGLLHNDISASYLVILPTWWEVLTVKQLNKSRWHVALLLYWYQSDAVTHHWIKKNKIQTTTKKCSTSVKYCDTNWNKSQNWKLTSIMRTSILAIVNIKEKKCSHMISLKIQLSQYELLSPDF